MSKNFFLFFPSLNQYFPHIPYVASKNQKFWSETNNFPCVFHIWRKVKICLKRKQNSVCHAALPSKHPYQVLVT
jgi:hypothetical protein